MKLTKINPYFEAIARNNGYKKSKLSSVLSGVEKYAFLLAEKMVSQYATPTQKTELVMSFQGVARELRWNDAGREVIFVDSSEFLKLLSNSKFDFDKVLGLEPLSRSFHLSLPTDFADGCHSFFVTWSKTAREEYFETSSSMRELAAKCGHSMPVRNEADAIDYCGRALEYLSVDYPAITAEQLLDEQIIKISYTAPDNTLKHRIIYQCQFADAISGDIASKTPEEKVAHDILKIILGLTIYVSAGGEIRAGLPNIPATSKRAFVGSSFSSKTVSLGSNSDQIHGEGKLRGFHFRNLKDERYYRLPEFQDAVRGSRWTFVKPYWVGEKISPRTI